MYDKLYTNTENYVKFPMHLYSMNKKPTNINVLPDLKLLLLQLWMMMGGWTFQMNVYLCGHTNAKFYIYVHKKFIVILQNIYFLMIRYLRIVKQVQCSYIITQADV